MNRKNPLVDVVPIFEHDFSVYPDGVRIAMEDGKVINYWKDVELPAPVFRQALDHYNETCQIGYRRPEEKRRRRMNRNG